MTRRYSTILAGWILWLAASPNAWSFYNPTTGRWLSRDPIGESGDRNLYTFLQGAPTTSVDGNGLIKWQPNQVVDTTTKVRSSDKQGELVPVVYLKGKTGKGTEIYFWKPTETKDYWCHGFTFDGVDAPGGPYSPFGESVPSILTDEWKPAPCACAEGGIVVFYRASAVQHSGKVTRVVVLEAHLGQGDWQLNEVDSILKSKWDSNGELYPRNFQTDWRVWGQYRCYVKDTFREPSKKKKGCPLCSQVKKGEHEL